MYVLVTNLLNNWIQWKDKIFVVNNRKTWREAVKEKFELNIVVYTSPT